MKRCDGCGTEVEAGGRFCPECGRPAALPVHPASLANQVPPAGPTPPATPPEKSSTGKTIGGLLAMGFLAYRLWLWNPGGVFDGVKPPGPVSFGSGYTSSLKVDGEKSRFVFGEAFAFCATLSRGAGTRDLARQFWVVQSSGDRRVAEDVIHINEATAGQVCQRLPGLLIVPGTSPGTYTIRMEVGDGKKILAKGTFLYQFPY